MSTAPDTAIIEMGQPETAIAERQQGATVDLMSRFQPANFADLKDFAKIVVTSKICGVDKPADALVIMMTGAELGLSVMQSLRGIHVVKGKPVLAADTMGAIVQRAAVCEWLRVVEMTSTRCTLETQRRGEPQPVSMTWTMEQAAQARLNGDNWRKYPAAMLKARCLAQLCRAVYPDVIAGLYDPDELTEGVTIERESQGQRRGTERAGAANELWSLVRSHVGEERALVWRGHYLEGVGADELWDVPGFKLKKMLRAIDGAEDKVAYIEACIARAEEKAAPANDNKRRENPVEVEVEAPEPAFRDQAKERREEMVALLGESVDDAKRDRFIAAYVARLGEANSGKAPATLEEVDAQKLGSMCRKLKGMGVTERGHYVTSVLEDFEANESGKVTEAIAEGGAHTRYVAANRSWWGAATAPYLVGVEGLDEAAAKAMRKSAQAKAQALRDALKGKWGVASMRDLEAADFERRVEVLAGMPLEARRDYIEDIIKG